jgi:hypothetical protein
MKKRRRLFKRIFIFLLAGAIVNVAVAWGCAGWSSFRPVPDVAIRCDIRGNKYWILVARQSGFGIDRTDLAGHLPAPTETNLQQTVYFRASIHSQELTAVPVVSLPWSRLGQTNNRVAVINEDEQVCGWPFRAMWCSIGQWYGQPDGSYSPVDDNGSMIMIKCSAGAGNGPERYLPLIAIWPGFAINTIFYAAILWGLFTLPGVVKRHRRRKRGLCPACAYPIGTWGGEVCTECGALVRARTKGAQECSHE